MNEPPDELARTAPHSVTSAVLAAWGIALAAFGSALLTPKTAPPDPVQAARAFYASQPRYLQPLPFTAVPAGLPDLRSKTCGACHVEIYAEWAVSTHARAWLDDAQFQEELKKSRASAGKDVAWMCVNCHTPLENQLERLVTGLEGGDYGRPIYTDNPRFDPELQLDAIGCASCHVKDGVVLGPFGDTTAPHPTRKAPELLSADQCTQCHQAVAVFERVPLGCFFTTGEEFAAGPDSAKGGACQQCHMPEVVRPLVPGGRPRLTRRHAFGGSLIPKRPQDEAGLARVRKHFKSGARLEWENLPTSASPGSTLRLSFAVTNANAGHLLPTGDPERHLELRARVLGSAGGVLAERVETVGAIYEWDPIRKVSDNRLRPRERRTFELEVAVPATGELTLELMGDSWRMHEKDFDYHELAGRAVRGRRFSASEARIPIR